jgi:hypothetical protein
MRIVVVGASGAGKTTLARRIAALLELPQIELDAVNWQSGWRDLTRLDPEEFVRRVTEAIAAEAWVVDGNYGPVRDLVWQRATHLVWLDYERPGDHGSGDFPFDAPRPSADRATGRQPRALAPPAAAQPPDSVGLEYLGPAPPRNRGTVGPEGICTSPGANAAPPNRSTEGNWPSGGNGRNPNQPGRRSAMRLKVGRSLVRAEGAIGLIDAATDHFRTPTEALGTKK